jgi:hypothetical protein
VLGIFFIPLFYAVIVRLFKKKAAAPAAAAALPQEAK